jgi:hypothetical protein
MLSKYCLLFVTFCIACNTITSADKIKKIEKPFQTIDAANPFKKILDIPLPEGYIREPKAINSFGEWLENIKLKKDRTVYKFDGTRKYNQSAQFAVLNISVGPKDLQQCADAVMRLRAEYLYSLQKFDEIIFSDNENHAYKFIQPYNRINFVNYLDRVFGMCASASLAKQLKKHIEMKNIEPGDVLIRGGFPGHAVIVMDVAINNEGNKIYLLAQSYMPAQDIHVLKNFVDKDISPWYKVNDKLMIETPEYTFTKDELKRW